MAALCIFQQNLNFNSVYKTQIRIINTGMIISIDWQAIKKIIYCLVLFIVQMLWYISQQVLHDWPVQLIIISMAQERRTFLSLKRSKWYGYFCVSVRRALWLRVIWLNWTDDGWFHVENMITLLDIWHKKSKTPLW